VCGCAPRAGLSRVRTAIHDDAVAFVRPAAPPCVDSLSAAPLSDARRVATVRAPQDRWHTGEEPQRTLSKTMQANAEFGIESADRRADRVGRQYEGSHERSTRSLGDDPRHAVWTPVRMSGETEVLIGTSRAWREVIKRATRVAATARQCPEAAAQLERSTPSENTCRPTGAVARWPHPFRRRPAQSRAVTAGASPARRAPVRRTPSPANPARRR
jgi:hypothetical protein